MRLRLAIASLVLVAACGAGETPPIVPPVTTPKTVDVFTVVTAFSPTPVTINAGDAVRFNIVATNGEGHDVTFDAKTGAPNNIPVTLNGVVTRTFNTKGTFHYNCFVHPGMSGDVIVQ